MEGRYGSGSSCNRNTDGMGGLNANCSFWVCIAWRCFFFVRLGFSSAAAVYGKLLEGGVGDGGGVYRRWSDGGFG
jgi:hypothetical protein